MNMQERTVSCCLRIQPFSAVYHHFAECLRPDWVLHPSILSHELWTRAWIPRKHAGASATHFRNHGQLPPDAKPYQTCSQTPGQTDTLACQGQADHAEASLFEKKEFWVGAVRIALHPQPQSFSYRTCSCSVHVSPPMYSYSRTPDLLDFLFCSTLITVQEITNKSQTCIAMQQTVE